MSEVMQFQSQALIIPGQSYMNRAANIGIFAGAERVYISRCKFTEITYLITPSPLPALPSIQRPSRLFTGRSEYLSRLKEYFSSYTGGQRRFLLHGFQGMGKTQICLKFVEQHANLFSDIFWIDASSESNIEVRLKQIALAYNAPPQSGESAKSILQWISERSDWLIVYDGANGDNSVVKKFLPPGNGGNILITSRNTELKGIISGRNYAEVFQMTDEEATSLFSQAAMLDGSSDETNVAQKIVSHLDGIPILVDKAGEFVQASACTVDDYADMVPKHIGQLLTHCGLIMASDLGPPGTIEEIMVANLSIEDTVA